MPPNKEYVLNANLSTNQSITLAPQPLQLVTYRIATNADTTKLITVNIAICTTDWSMDLANYAQTHLFVLIAVEMYAMSAIVDIISTMEPVSLASLIAQDASILPTVKYYIRLQEGYLSRSIVKRIG